MAITILKNTNWGNMPESNILLPLRKTIDLKVKADGTIVTPNGQQLPVLDLGMQGDCWATVLRFDLQELYLKGFLQNKTDNLDEVFSDYYYATLHVLLVDGETVINIDFDGVNFYVPEEITQQSGTLKFIYTLKEIDDQGNHPEIAENFVSSEFTGTISANGISDVEIEEVEEFKNEVTTFKKPSVHLMFDDNKILKLNTVGGSRLGYAQDSYITDVKVSGLAGDTPITYTIYFIGESVKVGVTLNSENRTWIPSKVTQSVGEYQVIVHAATDNGEQMISNPVKLEVVSNFLK